MQKLATTEFPILDVLKERWSPRAYANRPLESDKLWSLLEAARWSPSAANEQPWSFLVALKGEPGFDKLVSTLSGSNLQWAPNASALILSIAKLTRSNGAPNRHAHYDVGQAVAHLSVQAGAMGLSVRQMGGFDAAKTRELFAIPEGYDPVTILAVGYFGDLDQLDADLRERELSERKRKPLSEMVFKEQFGQAVSPPVPAKV